MLLREPGFGPRCALRLLAHAEPLFAAAAPPARQHHAGCAPVVITPCVSRPAPSSKAKAAGELKPPLKAHRHAKAASPEQPKNGARSVIVEEVTEATQTSSGTGHSVTFVIASGAAPA